MSDPKVSEALTKLLCSNGGQLSRTQLSELLELSVEQIDQVLLEEAHRFPVLSEDLVVARSPVRLCTEYMRGQPEEDGCGKLHLCHFHIRGRCWNKKSKCKLGHNIQSEHNLTVLKNNEISLLSKKELKVLLLQNDHSLLPGVCWKNIHEGCDQGDACRKLHVCGFFIKGECYRRDCKFSHNLHDPTLSLILKRSGYTNVNIQNLQMLCVLKNKETLQAREGLRKFVPKARKQTISVYNMGLKAQKPSMSSNDTAYRKTGIQAMNSHWTDNEYYSDKDHWNILEEQPKIFISSKAKGEQGSPHSSNIAGIQALSSHWTDNEYSDEDHWNILEEQPKIFISSKAKGEEGSPHSSNIAGESVMTSTTVNSSVPISSSSVGHSSISVGSSSLINKSATISAQKTDFSLNANVSDSIPIYSKLDIPNNVSASVPSMVQQSTSTTDNVKTPVPASSQQNNSGANTFPNVSSTSSSNPQQNTFANADFIKNVSTAAPPVSQPITSTNNATNASSSLTSNQQITFSKLYETLNKPAASIQPSQRTPSAALTTRSPVHGTLSYRTAAARGYRKVSYGVTELDLYTDVRSSVSSPVDSTTTLSKVNQNYIFNKKSDLAKIDDVKEICVFNVWDYCKLGINCGEMHYHLPYRWQYLDGTEWKDLSHMEETEKAYSDPSMDRGHLVDFRTMKSGTSEARRLSTASSVTKPSQYSLTTEWLWYWKDETGSWIQYGDMNIKQQSASISSDDLETVYLANPKDVCPFQAGSQSYEINFKEMVQRNLVYKTQREVRRRPQYRSLDDVRQLRRSSNATTAISSKETGVYPSHWDSSALPDIGYKLVNVSPTSTEYMDIRKMFLKTMPHQAVMKIRRIQNPSLWKFFQLQKEQMKKVNKGKNVDERQLFHGTNNSHIQTICNENFDWRICGTNGTMYGKGSYFARDASYSHNYSNPDIGGKRSMFVTRVLVGDFVRGDPTMKRPPYKSNSTNQSYDSCVDTTYNPSIFVVFEKHQIYPEYLMEYAQCQWYEETKVDKTGCCIS
ncbi:protein mono-ADP-ribosyltransferase PARP12 isoform X1 [Bombina bombina]|uniref:protein mono-ADP-ribosyltransferase PARP12 isoform X1 n=1 Tax=Bombina bombina TaxID=8345 RepID=UPI00235AECFE|nr:protein mono-ADP-ribosyltransferase PARP12 isoform X1 [Bombina bombina]